MFQDVKVEELADGDVEQVCFYIRNNNVVHSIR